LFDHEKSSNNLFQHSAILFDLINSTPTVSLTDPFSFTNYNGDGKDKDGEVDKCTIPEDCGSVFSIKKKDSTVVHYGDHIYTVASNCKVPYEGSILSIYENGRTVPEDLAASFQFPVTFKDNQFQVGAVEMCLVASILGASTDNKDNFFHLVAALFDPTIITPAPTEAPYFINFNGNPNGNTDLCSVSTDNAPITGSPTDSPTNAPHFLVSVLSVLTPTCEIYKAQNPPEDYLDDNTSDRLY